MSTESQIRNRVLRGLALNRTPGYHFTGKDKRRVMEMVATHAHRAE